MRRPEPLKWSPAASAVSALAVVLLAAASPAVAQREGLTLPPSGDNQHARVGQWIGPIEISIDYRSPNVHAPDGTDRRGKIWGGLVPWGMADLGFGTCGALCPWRGGANENTVFSVSHDVRVQGQPLPAGTYGLFFVPGEKEWTIIFSKNSTSWGSFFYDVREDALRVTAVAEKSDYHEWLTYEFGNREADSAIAALLWEDLKLPCKVQVDYLPGVYVAALRRELRDSPGFSWNNWVAASQYCLNQKTNLVEAESWARQAVSAPFFGQENFQTLSNLAALQEANGKMAEAKGNMDKALAHPTATALDLHQWGRQLLQRKKPQEALAVFQVNAKRHAGAWPTEVGLARGYSAVGNYKEALKHAKIAVAQAPDAGNKKFLEGAIEKLAAGQDLN